MASTTHSFSNISQFDNLTRKNNNISVWCGGAAIILKVLLAGIINIHMVL